MRFLSDSKIKYKDLPNGRCEKALALQRSEAMYCYITKPLIDGLAKLFAGKNVLEIYAGRGHMSALLHEQGVSIKSTSLVQGHDASRDLGHVFDVEEMDAVSAVEKYRDWIDYVLVCWPTTDYGMVNMLKNLPKDAPIVFIGEVTDYTVSPPFLGSCATDEFFDAVKEKEGLDIQYETFGHSKLKLFTT